MMAIKKTLRQLLVEVVDAATANDGIPMPVIKRTMIIAFNFREGEDYVRLNGIHRNKAIVICPANRYILRGLRPENYDIRFADGWDRPVFSGSDFESHCDFHDELRRREWLDPSVDRR